MRSQLLLVVVLGCGGGSSSNQGELDGPCYPNGTCNVGLSCMAGTCVPADAAVPLDVAVDAAVDVALDASIDAAFVCADDTALEPNDSIQTAFQTPVESQQQGIAFGGLAICPDGDKDTFEVEVTTANRNLEAIASWEDGAPVDVSILDAGGSSIGDGTPMGASAMRICTPNLPVGTYFVQTSAGNLRNNYSLVVRVVPSC